ncbi:sensor histidine kinase [Evansella sp. AB-P1]|uniref:sensor histidine kinase n=1 Tax=Evansella sp. AB-P1 TaxID=3037653 RepID=UPI00241CF6DC|nr:sensor histidine kinase [Evansella sp. AB-P1]MDG5785986.1 sensor histidine kinase [Evansella sp. AB-P1]
MIYKKKNTFLRILLMIDRPLTEKMIVIFTVIVVVPLITVGYISYMHSSKVLEHEAREYNWQMIEQVKMYTEDYLRDYEITTLKIVNHPDTIDFLRMSSENEMEERGMNQLITNVLRNHAFSQSDIANITLVLENKAIVDSAGLANRETASQLMEESWYSTITGVGGPSIVSRVIQWHGRELPVISVVKRIANPQTLQPFGMLIIDLNYQRLRDVARQITPGKSGYLFIVDQEGRYVYHPSTSKIGTEYTTEYQELMQGETSGSFLNSYKEPDLITYSQSSQLDWTLATATPFHEVTEGIDYIKDIIFKTVIISLLVVFIIAYSFSTNILRPIKRLQKYMQRVEDGNFSRRVPVESIDEVGQLSDGFNKMMDQISSLVHEVYNAQIRETELRLRQKETELKALQSQMNPHFLYNSLETIRGMALESDKDDIATISSSMGKLLRYNLREQNNIVKIEQEKEMIQLYLRIQKYRFEDKVSYNINLPDWCMEQRISRFSLQPLIENCIVHVVEPCAGRTMIEVTAEKQSEAAFVLWIKDTGKGMTTEIIERLQKDLDKKDISTGGSHIGMVNVHRRNQLNFGEKYGLVIKDTNGNGTVIGIHLPYDKEVE